MGENIDPDKLVAISEVAKEYGYHPSYLTRRAAAGKLKAWRFANVWVTTREILAKYVKTVRPAGRPKKQKRK